MKKNEGQPGVNPKNNPEANYNTKPNNRDRQFLLRHKRTHLVRKARLVEMARFGGDIDVVVVSLEKGVVYSYKDGPDMPKFFVLSDSWYLYEGNNPRIHRVVDLGLQAFLETLRRGREPAAPSSERFVEALENGENLDDE